MARPEGQTLRVGVGGLGGGISKVVNLGEWGQLSSDQSFHFYSSSSMSISPITTIDVDIVEYLCRIPVPHVARARVVAVVARPMQVAGRLVLASVAHKGAGRHVHPLERPGGVGADPQLSRVHRLAAERLDPVRLEDGHRVQVVEGEVAVDAHDLERQQAAGKGVGTASAPRPLRPAPLPVHGGRELHLVHGDVGAGGAPLHPLLQRACREARHLDVDNVTVGEVAGPGLEGDGDLQGIPHRNHPRLVVRDRGLLEEVGG